MKKFTIILLSLIPAFLFYSSVMWMIDWTNYQSFDFIAIYHHTVLIINDTTAMHDRGFSLMMSFFGFILLFGYFGICMVSYEGLKEKYL